jgi:hypothetical protein
VRYNNSTDTPLPPEEAAGRNPPDGAVIDYYLREPGKEISLEILSTAGQVVRRYSRASTADGVDLRELNIPGYWIRPPVVLSAEPGMHRFVWDLHYPPPDALRHEYPISAVIGDTPRLPLGPVALPGTYVVKLTVDGTTMTQPLTVRMDPRVQTPRSGLVLRFNAAARVADMMHRDYAALQQLRAAGAGQHTDDARAGVERELTALNADLSAVYEIIEGADAAPTVQTTKAIAALQQTLGRLLARAGRARGGVER